MKDISQAAKGIAEMVQNRIEELRARNAEKCQLSRGVILGSVCKNGFSTAAGEPRCGWP
jgi:hypothetical protein